MRKNLTLFLLTGLLMTFISCSSDDEQEYFEYTYDNNDVDITNWYVVKNGERFVIEAFGSEQNFAIEFDQYGHLATAASYSTGDFDFPFSDSFEYYSSYTFNLDIENIDTDNQMIKGGFDGILFEDNYEFNSPRHEVSGSFNLKYTEEPETELSKMYCEIDGKEWRATKGSESWSSSSNIELSSYNDDEYIINLYFDFDNIDTCSDCSFTDNSDLRINLNIYDIQNDEIVSFSSTGVISVTNYIAPTGFAFGVIEGTFSFTAVNPYTNQTYTVNNGTFKQYFD